MNTPKQQKPFFLYIIISILAVAVIGSVFTEWSCLPPVQSH